MYYVYTLSIYISICPSVQASIIMSAGSLNLFSFSTHHVFQGLAIPAEKHFSVAVIVIAALFIYQLPWPRSQCVKALTRNLSQSGAYRKENTARASLRLHILITNVTANGFLGLTGLISESSDLINRFIDLHNEWTTESLRSAIRLTVTRTFHIFMFCFTTLSLFDLQRGFSGGELQIVWNEAVVA